jgi:hypothetical protein
VFDLREQHAVSVAESSRRWGRPTEIVEVGVIVHDPPAGRELFVDDFPGSFFGGHMKGGGFCCPEAIADEEFQLAAS